MSRPKRKCSDLTLIKLNHSIHNDTSLDGIKFSNEQNVKRKVNRRIYILRLLDNPLAFKIYADDVPDVIPKNAIEILMSFNK